MENFKTKRGETRGVLVAVPEADLLAIRNQLIRIEAILDTGTVTGKTTQSDEYITESQVKTEYKVGATWLWDKRTTGQLNFSKVGGKVYYRRGDVIAFLDKNNSKTARKR